MEQRRVFNQEPEIYMDVVLPASAKNLSKFAVNKKDRDAEYRENLQYVAIDCDAMKAIATDTYVLRTVDIDDYAVYIDNDTATRKDIKGGCLPLFIPSKGFSKLTDKVLSIALFRDTETKKQHHVLEANGYYSEVNQRWSFPNYKRVLNLSDGYLEFQKGEVLKMGEFIRECAKGLKYTPCNDSQHLFRISCAGYDTFKVEFCKFDKEDIDNEMHTLASREFKLANYRNRRFSLYFEAYRLNLVFDSKDDEVVIQLSNTGYLKVVSSDAKIETLAIHFPLNSGFEGCDWFYKLPTTK